VPASPPASPTTEPPLDPEPSPDPELPPNTEEPEPPLDPELLLAASLEPELLADPDPPLDPASAPLLEPELPSEPPLLPWLPPEPEPLPEPDLLPDDDDVASFVPASPPWLFEPELSQPVVSPTAAARPATTARARCEIHGFPHLTSATPRARAVKLRDSRRRDRAQAVKISRGSGRR